MDKSMMSTLLLILLLCGLTTAPSSSSSSSAEENIGSDLYSKRMPLDKVEHLISQLGGDEYPEKPDSKLPVYRTQLLKLFGIPRLASGLADSIRLFESSKSSEDEAFVDSYLRLFRNIAWTDDKNLLGSLYVGVFPEVSKVIDTKNSFSIKTRTSLLELIFALTQQSENIKDILENGFDEKLIQSMTNSEMHANTSLPGCGILWNLGSADPKLARRVLEHSGVKWIEKALTEHTNTNPLCHYRCCGALRNYLTKASSDDMSKFLMTPSLVSSLLVSIHSQLQPVQSSAACVESLRQTTRYNPALTQDTSTIFNLDQIIPTVWAAMDSHRESAEYQLLGLLALLNVTRDGLGLEKLKSNQKQLLANLGVSRMTIYKSKPHVSNAGCELLRAIKADAPLDWVITNETCITAWEKKATDEADQEVSWLLKILDISDSLFMIVVPITLFIVFLWALGRLARFFGYQGTQTSTDIRKQAEEEESEEEDEDDDDDDKDNNAKCSEANQKIPPTPSLSEASSSKPKTE